jgi:hypothetical protein
LGEKKLQNILRRLIQRTSIYLKLILTPIANHRYSKAELDGFLVAPRTLDRIPVMVKGTVDSTRIAVIPLNNGADLPCKTSRHIMRKRIHIEMVKRIFKAVVDAIKSEMYKSLLAWFLEYKLFKIPRA